MNTITKTSGSTERASNRRRLTSMAAVLAIGLAALSACVPSGPGGSGFRASVSGTATQTSDTTFELTGSGRASRMGSIEYRGEVTITDTDPGTGVITDTLVETLTALNGDTLTILCEQVATPEAPGSSVLNGVDSWTVIGGTGRFSEATGSGTGRTRVDLATGEFTKAFTGSITY